MGYRTYQTTPVSSGGLAPTFLTGPTAQAFEGALGDLKDFLASKAKMAVQARMPLKSPADALARLAIERGLLRGATETDAQLAVRCQAAWQTWPFAGTAYGVLQALYQTGYQNVILAQVRGGLQYTLDNGGTNLFLWSNLFTNAAWTIPSLTVRTANAGTAPDGTTTATKLSEGASGLTVEHYIEQPFSVAASGSGTISAYAKAVERGWIFLNFILRDGVTVKGAYFNLSTGAIGTTDAGYTARGTPSTNGFFRCELTGSVGSGGSSPKARISIATADGTKSYIGSSGSGVLLAYAQAENSSSAATPYSDTFSAAKTSALPAGSLVTKSPANGIWETDPLSIYSPLDQAFWSKFDVLFPLPLQAPSFSWATGIPSSSSNEANFIRALVGAWKPAFATTNRIIIQTAGRVLGYPIRTIGASNGTLGGNTTVIWSP